MFSNGSVYMKRVKHSTRFHKQWLYFPWWPFINRSKHMPERFKYTMLDRVAAKLSHSITCPLHDCFTHTSGLAHAHSTNYTLAHTPQFIVWKTYRSCHIIIVQCGLTFSGMRCLSGVPKQSTDRCLGTWRTSCRLSSVCIGYSHKVNGFRIFNQHQCILQDVWQTKYCIPLC